MDLAQDLYQGLSALAENSFPKTCSYCGRIYEDEAQFLEETEEIGKHSGLKQGYCEEDNSIVELYRNCSCGSTLMVFCNDRRVNTPAGEARRKKFQQLLDAFVEKGVDAQVAADELRKVVRGGKSELLEAYINKD